MSDRSNKTEKPTPRKIEKARREGNFPNTKQLLSGIQLSGVCDLVRVAHSGLA